MHLPVRASVKAQLQFAIRGLSRFFALIRTTLVSAILLNHAAPSHRAFPMQRKAPPVRAPSRKASLKYLYGARHMNTISFRIFTLFCIALLVAFSPACAQVDQRDTVQDFTVIRAGDGEHVYAATYASGISRRVFLALSCLREEPMAVALFANRYLPQTTYIRWSFDGGAERRTIWQRGGSQGTLLLDRREVWSFVRDAERAGQVRLQLSEGDEYEFSLRGASLALRRLPCRP